MHLYQIDKRHPVQEVEDLLLAAAGPNPQVWNRLSLDVGTAGWLIRLPHEQDIINLQERFNAAGVGDWLEPWGTGEAMGNHYNEPNVVPGAAIAPLGAPTPTIDVPDPAPTPTPEPAPAPTPTPELEEVEPSTALALTADLTEDDLALPIPVDAEPLPTPEPEPVPEPEDPDSIDEDDIETQTEVSTALAGATKALNRALHAGNRGRIPVNIKAARIAKTVAWDTAHGRPVAVIERGEGKSALHVEGEDVGGLVKNVGSILTDLLASLIRKKAPVVADLIDSAADPLLDAAASATADAVDKAVAKKPKIKKSKLKLTKHGIAAQKAHAETQATKKAERNAKRRAQRAAGKK